MQGTPVTIVRDSVMLSRRDDPLNEYRQILLYEDTLAPGNWAVEEVIKFLSKPETMRSSRRAQGGGYDMRNYFEALIAELRKEGFVICESDDVPATLRRK
jgi:hypothetical protein